MRSPSGQAIYRARLDPADARRMIATLRPGGPGPYAVTWTAVAADGDTITGDLEFRVRARPRARIPFSWAGWFGW